MTEKDKYQEAFDTINHVIDKVADWSGNDLSELNEEYGLFNAQNEVKELVDRAKPITPIEKEAAACGMMGFDFLCECGESVRQTNKFCPECGHPLKRSKQ